MVRSIAPLMLSLSFLVPSITSAGDIVDTAVAAGQFKTLAAALGAADLVNTLKGEGPFTVFAPTDAAFAKLPPETISNLLKPENKQQLASILTYHVVPGKVLAQDVVKVSQAKTVQGSSVPVQIDGSSGQLVVQVGAANVVKTDIRCSNGVIHVIDNVLLPPADNDPTAALIQEPVTASGSDIVETAVAAGSFNTLAAALGAADLVNTLKGDGPFTVFAPTDDAFAKLPPGTVENLLKPENKAKLIEVLTYHVLPGKVPASQVVRIDQAQTVQGSSVSITKSNGGVMVDNANVVTTDIECSNGIIHVIDSVILPKKSNNDAQAARGVIEHAISRGVVMYNSGHAGQCAKVYRDAMHQLVSHHAGSMSQDLVNNLSSTLHRCNSMQCQDSQAWALRHGLDAAYNQLLSSLR